jgi:hypothetical protein
VDTVGHRGGLPNGVGWGPPVVGLALARKSGASLEQGPSTAEAIRRACAESGKLGVAPNSAVTSR